MDNFNAEMDRTFQDANQLLDQKGGAKIKFDTLNEVKSSESKEGLTLEEWEKESRKSLGESINS